MIAGLDRCSPRARSAARTVLLAPLGFPLLVTSSCAVLSDAAVATCRGWEGAVVPEALPLRLTLGIDDGLSGKGNPMLSVDGMRLSLNGTGMNGWADARRGEAAGSVSEACLDDTGLLREAILEPLILFMLTRRDRTAIHASAFRVGDLAVILAGPSGTGKSCLALAADRAGFDLLSDDTVYVQTRPDLRLWGIPRPIHVFATDMRDEPAGPLRLRNGKHKHAITRPTSPVAVTATRAGLCVLTPGEKVSLDPIGQEEALDRLGPLEPGFDLLRAESDAALRLLTRNGAWRLSLSCNPREAIDLLHRRLDRLRLRAAS